MYAFFKKTIVLIVVLVGFLGCQSGKSEVSKPSASELKEVKKTAKSAIMKVGGTLKKNLQKEMKAKGAVGAAKFCSLSAVPLAKKVSMTLPEGVSVKRITSKARNMDNKANDEEMAILNELELAKSNGNMPKMVVKKISSNHYQVYKPIVMGGVCLLCHGTSSVRDAGAYKEILKHYPKDMAVDYKMGDLRGAFLVNITK